MAAWANSEDPEEARSRGRGSSSLDVAGGREGRRRFSRGAEIFGGRAVGGFFGVKTSRLLGGEVTRGGRGPVQRWARRRGIRWPCGEGRYSVGRLGWVLRVAARQNRRRPTRRGGTRPCCSGRSRRLRHGQLQKRRPTGREHRSPAMFRTSREISQGESGRRRLRLLVRTLPV